MKTMNRITKTAQSALVVSATFPKGFARLIVWSCALLGHHASVTAEPTEVFTHADFTFIAGPITLTVVGFDDVGSGQTFSDDQYADLGLTVVHRDGRGQMAFDPAAAPVCCYTAANRQSAPNVMSSADFSGIDSFDFIFAQDVYAAGLWIGNISPGTTEVQFLGADGSILASEVIAHTHYGIISGGGDSWDVRLFYGVISDTPIGRIRTVEGCCDSDGVTYDDVTFTSLPDLDADDDGVLDSEDNCLATPNVDQADSDGDGVGDVCDICPLDPLNDADGDAVCGRVDNCPTAPNPDQVDSDGDGIGDVCDRCRLDPANDADGDFWCGNEDNCPDMDNPEQDDWDSDGLGDACDLDDDDDGVPDESDNCPRGILFAIGSTILFSGCDTGVPNVVLGSGCTMVDVLAHYLLEAEIRVFEDGEQSARKYWINSVKEIANWWFEGGLVTKKQAKAMERCAKEVQFTE